MKQFTFTSQLAPIIWKYLESRQNEGYTSVHCGYYMQELDCLSKELSDAPVVTKELIDAWDLLKPYGYKELRRRNIMAVDNASQIDAIANDKENACLVLLITDHLNWDNEFEHLKILQDKINAYVAFIESEQYDEIYPNADFKMAMIEIHFKYDITDNCQKFLQVVQDQLGRIGIKIKAQIS